MVKKVFYEKVGRRYKPVREYDSEFAYALPQGAHLILVCPGSTTTRHSVDPAYAPMIAAGHLALDAISRHIMEVSALRPPEQNKPLTQEQVDAWHALARAMGQDRYALEWCSYREAAEAGVKAIMEEAEKLMQHESVKQAFEQFLLVCELTKKHSVDQQT